MCCCLKRSTESEERFGQRINKLDRDEREEGDDGAMGNPDLAHWFLDDSIVFPGMSLTNLNLEPLLVNVRDSWRYRPEAGTQIANLVLASDYVRTNTDLATMEGANEAARRAVNAILDRSGSTAARCRVWPLREPGIFYAARAADRVRYDLGLGHCFAANEISTLLAQAMAAGGASPGVFAPAPMIMSARSGARRLTRVRSIPPPRRPTP